MPNELTLLHRLARSYGVQTLHRDGFARPVHPTVETVLCVLRMLGASVEHLDDVSSALRQRRQCLWERGVEPVTLSWDGAPVQVNLRLPATLAETPVRYRLELEDGSAIEGPCQNDWPISPRRHIEGREYVARHLAVSAAVPYGYHKLRLFTGARALASDLVCAPRHSYNASARLGRPIGLFCPAYALTEERSWGAGDFSSLAAFTLFASQNRVAVVGTLPLLPAFLDEPFDPSPYAPVSRLFWNEFYIDVERIPGVADCAAARALLDSASFRDALRSLRAAPLIDYRRLMALKRSVLEELLAALLSTAGVRRSSYENYVAAHPNLQDYAGFRARVERDHETWQHWPGPARTGVLGLADVEESARNYHLFVQWLATEQMLGVGATARERGVSLYLDFPLGVNRDGYDVWRNQDLFVLGASAGAPPDGLFVGGQNWGFPPLHPEAIRLQGYRYLVDCLRHHLQPADFLRIDHVMGLHRMYWIPQGAAATEGIYVHGKAAELYAILCLESHRHRAQIVGENLGTVPFYTNEALARHRIFGMPVGQFGVDAGGGPALQPIAPGNVASVNTHDTATFAGFWHGSEIQDRVELGLLDAAQATHDHDYRGAQRRALSDFLRGRNLLAPDTDDPLAVLKAWLCFMAASRADLLLINLEDLWLEALPQNVPGTWNERPNWRRKARHTLASLRENRAVADILAAVAGNRGWCS
ncbi:MAG: 4-alpha-glucanotransferase [Deltaproteobacteria bacterium]|nr:4-alpha-glucanotransferase [Deltaproteobacteria bacterium]